MRSITQHYEGKNIYTRPLQGKPYYRNSGIIYAVDRSGNKYSVARVDLERFDDQNFQYVFTPDWDTIDIRFQKCAFGLRLNKPPSKQQYKYCSHSRYMLFSGSESLYHRMPGYS